MSFIEEITSFIGSGLQKYRYVVLDGKEIYLEGVKSIQKLSETFVTLEMKEGSVSVEGEKLCVRKYCAGDVCVCGKIAKVINE